jgi:hypothetical protein
MIMLTVESHEYDPQTGIDTFVFGPINMKAQVKVVQRDGKPQVLLGVQATYVQQEVTEPEWSVCTNKEIIEFALREYEARQ